MKKIITMDIEMTLGDLQSTKIILDGLCDPSFVIDTNSSSDISEILHEWLVTSDSKEIVTIPIKVTKECWDSMDGKRQDFLIRACKLTRKIPWNLLVWGLESNHWITEEVLKDISEYIEIPPWDFIISTIEEDEAIHGGPHDISCMLSKFVVDLIMRGFCPSDDTISLWQESESKIINCFVGYFNIKKAHSE